MMDLFSYSLQQEAGGYQPLAVRMRPRTLAEFIGQDDIVGQGKFLWRLIADDTVPSLILFGPPGTGKTTLAAIVAQKTGSHYEELNAVSSGVADIRKVTEGAKERLRLYRKRTILFIDEIHRFNKSQQDALLPYVEDGRITLIGATTENPYFEINAPLLSRMRVIRLQPLTVDAVVRILKRAITDQERGYGQQAIIYTDEVLQGIVQVAGGDARTALNILEQAVTLLPPDNLCLTLEIIATVCGEKVQIYDKQGDNHYDVASAFIKSMRGSDPDAALHYLARMLAAGEDVKFIARRIVICAAEDVGNADPQALQLAMAAAQAVQFIGMPEARIVLGQAVTYIAAAPKSNAAYLAINQALADVTSRDCGTVPLHLRDAHYKGAKQFGHGQDYCYPHDYPHNWVEQDYLPEKIKGTVYYRPTVNGHEAKLSAHLQALQAAKGKK